MKITHSQFNVREVTEIVGAYISPVDFWLKKLNFVLRFCSRIYINDGDYDDDVIINYTAPY